MTKGHPHSGRYAYGCPLLPWERIWFLIARDSSLLWYTKWDVALLCYQTNDINRYHFTHGINNAISPKPNSITSTQSKHILYPSFYWPTNRMIPVLFSLVVFLLIVQCTERMGHRSSFSFRSYSSLSFGFFRESFLLQSLTISKRMSPSYLIPSSSPLFTSPCLRFS